MRFRNRVGADGFDDVAEAKEAAAVPEVVAFVRKEARSANGMVSLSSVVHRAFGGRTEGGSRSDNKSSRLPKYHRNR